MTREPVSLDDLLATRRKLFTELPACLTEQHRSFLASLVKAEPDWSLMTCEHLAAMPAIRWKLTNLERLRRTNPEKFAAQASELEKRW